MSELMAIINKEVPTAVLKGRPVRNTNAGIIKKPPPAPTSPVRNPISKPSIITRNVLKRWLADVGSFFFRISETEASTISKANKPSTSPRLVKINPLNSTTTSGIAGTIHLRVQKIAMMEGMPNRMPVFKLISCSRYFGIAPTKLVTPTMNNEYADAITGSTPKR